MRNKKVLFFTLVVLLVAFSISLAFGAAKKKEKEKVDTSTYEVGSGKRPDEQISPGKIGTDKKTGLWIYPWTNMKASKPWKVGIGNFGSEWDYCVNVEKRWLRLGKQWGIQVKIYDNGFDTAKALANADLAIADKVDIYLEWHVDATAMPTIAKKFKDAGIPFVPMDVFTGTEDCAFFTSTWGYGNMRDGGVWLGKYVKKNWGGKIDLILEMRQPRCGKSCDDRFVGYRDGLESVLGKLPDKLFVQVDGGGVLDKALEATAPALTAHPDAKYVLLLGSNDDDANGAVRAAQAAGRTEFTIAWGQPGTGSGIEALTRNDPIYKGSSWQDIESYTWPLSLAVEYLEGKKIPKWNWQHSMILTAENIKDIPPQYEIK